MLTTSHYLLGGFLAGSCAIGALLYPSNSNHSNLSNTLFDTSVEETVDISYRGSGRVDEEPNSDKTKSYSAVTPENGDLSNTHTLDHLYTSTSDDEDLISHRGSGRIRPFSL